jgi:DNA replication protein DnaC
MCTACDASSVQRRRQYEIVEDPTLADAILDRLVHHAYKITLQGESMRKRHARLTTGASVE